MGRVDVRVIRRDQILDAAEGVVARRGWEQTTFADLCRQADVSNGVLTYHFRDKDEILLALFDRLACRIRERFAPELEREGGLVASISEGLRETIRHGCREGTGLLPVLLVHFLSQASHRPEIAERLRGGFAQHRARLSSYLAAAAARGEIRDIDPSAAASLIQGLMLGFALSRLAVGPEAFTNQVAEEAAELLRCYLTGSPGPPGDNGGHAGASSETREEARPA